MRWIDSLLRILDQNEALLAAVGLLSLVCFVGTLLLVPYVIWRLPSDYFQRERRPRQRPRSPGWWLVMVAKNLLGLLALIFGVAMLVLPGQGLLTILIGLVLIDFPGKYRLERWLVSRRRLQSAVNWIRAKRKLPPLLPPSEESR